MAEAGLGAAKRPTAAATAGSAGPWLLQPQRVSSTLTCGLLLSMNTADYRARLKLYELQDKNEKTRHYAQQLSIGFKQYTNSLSTL